MKVKYCVVRFKNGKPKLTYLQDSDGCTERWTEEKSIAEYTVEKLSKTFPDVSYSVLEVPSSKIMHPGD
jgi:hypothetical protein